MLNGDFDERINYCKQAFIITSVRWLAWRLFDARASATIAMAYLGRCVSGVINVMTYQNGVWSAVSRLFRARPRATHSSLVLANHTRRYMGRGINLTHISLDKIAAISQNTRRHIQMRFHEWIPKGRVGFQSVWNLFMTRSVINCHKLYFKPV